MCQETFKSKYCRNIMYAISLQFTTEGVLKWSKSIIFLDQTLVANAREADQEVASFGP